MVGQQTSLNNLWSSRLVLRIAVALFLVILVVNALFSAMSLAQYKKDRLYDIEEIGLYSIIPALENASFDQTLPPITNKTADRLIRTTPITGMAYYNVNYENVGMSGEPIKTILHNNERLPLNSYDSSKGAYEVVYSPAELGISHYIVAQLNAAQLENEMDRQIKLEIIKLPPSPMP